MSSATSELLPDPATPVTHVSTPLGIRTERLRRLLVEAFSMRNASSNVRRLRRGHLLVEGSRCRGIGAQQVLETAAEDQLAAAVAGAGTDVHDPVRRADDRWVVLDDEHRVAVVTQALEHDDEVIDVPRMEPHGRLIVETSTSGC